MSDTKQSPGHSTAQPYVEPRRREPTAWAGVVVFAATMLLMVGGLQAMEGFVAILRDEYYLVTRNGLLVTVDYTMWGWVHLVVGLLAIAAGLGIFFAMMWARVLGIVIAVVSVLINIAFLPAYPVWISILIAMDVVCIYALATHGREVAG
jgi:hypothetical protein